MTRNQTRMCALIVSALLAVLIIALYGHDGGWPLIAAVVLMATAIATGVKLLVDIDWTSRHTEEKRSRARVLLLVAVGAIICALPEASRAACITAPPLDGAYRRALFCSDLREHELERFFARVAKHNELLFATLTPVTRVALMPNREYRGREEFLIELYTSPR